MENKKRANCFKDETGNVYGMLTVLQQAPPDPNRKGARWKCLCECGKTTIVLGINLRRGSTKSCGCLYLEKFVKRKNEQYHSTS